MKDAVADAAAYDRREAYYKQQALRTKRTLEFICQHPDGVTYKDFDVAGVPIYGMHRLVKLKLIVGTQVREPERGPRCYHWLWKPKRTESIKEEEKP